MKYTHEVLDRDGKLAYYWNEDNGDLYKRSGDTPWIQGITLQSILNSNLKVRFVEEEN